ncbi:MAG: Hsp20/alpha crystallin family protein, partial [Anaeroplasmataceae bacterium]|nr:Hsp20/alpha crystallin family protein [Anaeroplasmataceae bacterium]
MYFIRRTNDERKNSLADDFQNFFMDSFFSNKSLKTDIIENEKNYTLKVEIPGVDKKDVSLDYNNQYLTLTVHQEKETDTNDLKYVRKERSNYSCTRSYYLDNGDEENIKAKLENGILTIVIGKTNVLD